MIDTSDYKLLAGWLRAIVLAGLANTGLATAYPAENPDLSLWYARPATNWEQEALPIGNARIGAKIFGGIRNEHLQFNEDSLWIGDEMDTGAYQAFGDLSVDLDHPDGTEYRRELNLGQSVHTITYTSGGVHYRREYFASHPAEVMVLRFTADQPGAYTGSIGLRDAHRAITRALGQSLAITGALTNYSAKDIGHWGHDLARPFTIGLNYEAQARLINDGGRVEAREDRIYFSRANGLTIFLTAGTDYVQDRSKGWKGEPPHGLILERLNHAATTPYAALLAEHQRDYQPRFDRLKLNLGAASQTVRALPTDRRLEAYRQANPYVHPGTPSPDPELEALMFQYARYLMLSCSRPGGLPANLQGLWNQTNQPDWRCDYHTDVNVQMNYWFVDMANLSECFQPFTEWLWAVIPVKREAARPVFKTRGWALRSENGLFGGSSYHYVAGDAAWVAQNVWDHYAFTQDRHYLETRAYPILKELCEFWEDYLLKSPDGQLISPRSISPEHGGAEEGNAYEQQLVYDLFSNYLEAAKILDQDRDFSAKVADMRQHLLGPQIGSWGQLLEWRHELRRPEFVADARWEKNTEPAVARLQAAAAKEPNSAMGYAWNHFAPDLQLKLQENPRDAATLAAGLNALVAGGALYDEPAFAAARCEQIDDLHARRAERPEMARWENWCLLTRSLRLDGLGKGGEDTPLDTHRHTSHLIAVFPGRQITPRTTPELARAAGVSLAARGESGDSAREWAWVWRCAIWARLGNAERAYRCVAGLLTHNVMPNLLQTHPPFQIDGSFGYAAGVGEMLVQSHLDEITLLPALPAAWPDGAIQGLRARGGYTVDLCWEKGKVTSFVLHSTHADPVKIRVNGQLQTIIPQTP